MFRIKKYPREIYIFWIASFIIGIEFTGALLLPFFKDWGGLTQTIKGSKKSTILGMGIMALGTLTYILYPNFGMFMLSEFIFALGLAFISGSKEAWLYDISKSYKLDKEYRSISVTDKNFHLIGMLVSSFLTGFALKYFSVRSLFTVHGITILLSLLFLLMIPSIRGFKESNKIKSNVKKSFSPDYKKLLKKSLSILQNNKDLQKNIFFVVLLSSTSYFVIWLYQAILENYVISIEYYGTYRLVLLIAEILVAYFVSKYLEKKKHNAKLVGIIFSIVIGIGFLIPVFWRDSNSILFFLIFSGGLGLQLRTLYSKEFNDYIESGQRSTVLSFISMIRRFFLVFLNPFIGFITDSKGLFVALTILGVISLVSGSVLPNSKKTKIS